MYALVADGPGEPVGVEEGTSSAARAAAADFLDRYVDEDGWVVRHDQGGDTVSEGQSYATGAAGRPRERDRLIDQAARLDAAHPTYCGAAWVALGRALLTTDLLGGCGRGHAPADTLPSVLPFAQRAVYGAKASSGDWP